MKVILISYANKPFYKSQQQLKKSAYKYGIDEVIDYNEIWLKKQTAFYQKNKHILSQKRGNGFWLWKPFIILDVLKKMDENDIICYSDSGNILISSILPLVNLVSKNEPLLFCNSEHKNKIWTKRDCFYFMNCDNKFYHESFQVSAGFLLLKKTKANIKIIQEWLALCENENILTDIPNKCGLPNFEEYIDHRHDQSILSLLAIKNKIEIFRDPTQWGNKYKLIIFKTEGEFIDKNYQENKFSNSIYPTILHAHRKKLPLTLKDRWMLFLKRYTTFDSK